MKRRILPIVVIVGMLMAGLLSSPTSALAQASAVEVAPNSVINTVESILLVTAYPLPTPGNPLTTPTPIPPTFEAPVTVEVVGSGLGLLTATPVPSSPNQITFTLPAGCPPGRYTLRIRSSGTLNLTDTTNQLTVRQEVIPPVVTNTPAPTNFVRPLVTVFSYGASSVKLVPGQDFEIEMTLQNTGKITASNIVTTFVAGDFVPRATGGVRAVGDLGPGQSSKFYQLFTATTDLIGKKVGIMEVSVSYTDIYGAAYSETFTLTYPMTGGGGGGGPTITPTISPRPQLIISGYHADQEMLQPGTEFTLELEVRNVGNSLAKAVSAIVGGGSADSGGGGTPGPGGGVSGGGGEFTNFAPVGSSNIQVLGDMEAGASKKVSQKLIVNVSTNPGAYPLKVSFIYSGEQNSSFADDQVITLLVYKMPSVDVSFYRPLEPLFVGEMGVLPLQIANMGRSSAVLGNMTVSAGDAEMQNNTLIVGNVDPGFPVTLDAMVTPAQPGTLEVTVAIDYTDDFNKPRTISKTLEVEVIEGSPTRPGMGEEMGEFEPTPLPPETLMQKIWRFIRGFIGLDSARSDTSGPSFEGMPIEGRPIEEMPPARMPTEPPAQQAVPAPGGKG